MSKAFEMAKGAVSLAVLAFLVMAVCGVYTALDSATKGYGHAAEAAAAARPEDRAAA